MCHKLKCIWFLTLVLVIHSCQKPKPINNEHEVFVGVWEYQGVDTYWNPGSPSEWYNFIVINEFVENHLRLTILSNGSLLVETDDDVIYQGEIMNVGLSSGTLSYMPGVSLRSTCFYMHPPIGQLKYICAVVQDNNLRTRHFPFEVSGGSGWINNQLYSKVSE